MSDRRANPGVIRELRSLFASGALPRPVFERAMAAAGARRDWRRHADWLLVVLGAGFVLSGVVFFVAYNWSRFDATWKLVGLQGAVALCIVAAWNRGFDSIAGRAFGFAASLLVGVFLAAFGQVYPTGADAWEMLRGWSVLIVVWVVASRAPEQWLLLLAVVDGAIASWLDHVRFYDWEGRSGGWLLLSVTQLLVLVGFEAVRVTRARSEWPWLRWVLVPTLLWFLSLSTTMIIVGDHYRGFTPWALLLLFAAVLVGGLRWFRDIVRDLFALPCLGFAAIWTGGAVLVRLFDGDSDCGAFVLIGLYVLGGLAWLVRSIRRLATESAMGEGPHG
ncbi:MAG: DUF2157 domain-containing protein [Planctomycetes bacterium]|nr:DUF2157 domain-containing protein [Planctomycetota bacterium]